MTNWVNVYHRLPYSLRVVAASLKGYQLHSWRYGTETQDYIEQALERDHWSSQRWKEWQEDRLATILHRAATKVPYYREQWSIRRQKGDRSSWERLENWPVLTKEPVRVDARAFLAGDCDPRRMSVEHTSGTTGSPLTLWRSRETARRWYALNETRVKRWNGISHNDRWAILGGQLVANFQQDTPPFWVWNHGLQQLYLSSYHLAPGFAAHYVEALRRYGVTYLLGYPSAMTSLAEMIQECGLEAPQLRVAISNAEQLYAYQRETISRVFRCPVVDTYGMVEVAAAGSECSAGQMHLWPEVGMIEVFADEVDQPVVPGETGRFICTGLLNPDMPLIRYQIGDRGALAQNETGCSCGRSLPVLKQVEGRMDDVVVTPDGRKIGRLGPVFRDHLPVRQAQIIQVDRKSLFVKIIPAPGYNQETDQEIIRRLHDRVGDMDIRLERVDVIPRSANGKVRVIVSEIH